MDHLGYFCLVFVMLSWMHFGHLLGKGLTSRLSIVMSNCEGVTFSLVSWVRCGTRLYRFLILSFFLLWKELLI